MIEDVPARNQRPDVNAASAYESSGHTVFATMLRK